MFWDMQKPNFFSNVIFNAPLIYEVMIMLYIRWVACSCQKNFLHWLLMMPKCSPVRCTALTLEQPVLENREVQKTPSKGGPVWSRPNTLRRLSQKAFFTTLECWRGISYTYLFWGCWGLFIVVRSCLIFLQSKPHRLAEQAPQACWTSLPCL